MTGAVRIAMINAIIIDEKPFNRMLLKVFEVPEDIAFEELLQLLEEE